MLSGETDSVRIEDPSVEKAEFVVTIGSRQEFHQAKRSHQSGKWNLATLASDGLLQAIGVVLAGNQHRFVFVSSNPAPELHELSAAARDAKSLDEFTNHFLRAQARRGPFESLLQHWACDPATAIEFLKRIEVRTIGERDLEALIHWKVSALFLAKPDQVTAALSKFIEDSIHRTLRYEDFVAKLGEGGYRLRQIPDAGSAIIAVRRATDHYLAGERRRLIKGELVLRRAVETLLSRLEGHTDGVLTGRAGAGKSACVVQLVDALRAKGTPVLAFRLDRYLSAPTTADLGSSLKLEESPVAVLAAAADRMNCPAVLVIDQLDAASTMSGRRSEAIDLVGSLLNEARGTRPRALIHTVVVCRTFDWNHDHRLRKLIKDSSAQVDITEFEVAEVTAILDASGFDPASFRTSQLQLLRLPQNLFLFLESDIERSQTPTFSTVKELFDRYWDEKRQSVGTRVEGGTDQWARVIRILCCEMTSTQQLSVKRERLDDVPLDYVNQMTSEGVLVADGNAYGFGHESFFDYCFARLFVGRSESVVSLLVRSEQHLFRRAQVRQVLTYLRDTDHDRYVTELRALLLDDRVRPHIKDLAFGLLAEVADPTQDEWEIWKDWIGPALEAIADGTQNSNGLSDLAWRRLWTARSWFPFLEESDMIGDWMESGNDRLVDLALSYLRSHSRNWPDRVVARVEPYFDRGGQWESRVQRVVEWGPHQASRASFDLFLRLVGKGAFDKGPSLTGAGVTFWSLLYDLGEHRPGWCSEAMSYWFKRRLVIAHAIGEDLRKQEFLGFDRGAEKLIRKCAKDAPTEFVEYLLPAVLEIADFAQLPGEPPRRDAVWKWISDTNYPTVELACLLELGEALSALAKDGVEELRDVITDLRGRDTYVANFLLLALYSGGGPHGADEAISLLCVERWRFECGTTENPNWYAMKAIRRVVSRCTDESRERIQARILGYVPRSERTVTGYTFHGARQFALLSAIPEGLRCARAKARFAELQRKFGEPPGAPERAEAVWLSSPIAEGATQRMTDDQWLGAIERYCSELSPQSLRGEPIGGAVELARTLEERAREQPVRFAHLALKFPLGAHPVYLERTLVALKDAEISTELKLQVAKKAFEESLGACGMAITDVLGNITDRLPDDAVQMLHSLATEVEGPPDEIRDEVLVGGVRNPDRDIQTAGINSIRGRAAGAIEKLIRGDRENIDRFRETLEMMIRDPSVAVRSCVTGTLRAVGFHESTESISLFQRMDLSDDRLLVTRDARLLVLERLHDNFDVLRPIVERMLRSSDPTACQTGARFAGVASLLHESATDLAEEALSGGDKHRMGIAEIASANIADPRYRTWCEEKLSPLFNDTDSDVRAQAALCFQKLSTERLGRYERLIESYCNSLAYRDDPSPLLRALEESRERLPGITCVVCEKFLDAQRQDGQSIRDRHAWQIGTIAKLVFRTYQQYQGDPDWTCRSLSLIDRLCLETTGGAQPELEKFER